MAGALTTASLLNLRDDLDEALTSKTRCFGPAEEQSDTGPISPGSLTELLKVHLLTAASPLSPFRDPQRRICPRGLFLYFHR